MAGNRSQLNSRAGSRGGSRAGSGVEAGAFAQHYSVWDASQDEHRFSAFSGLGDVPGHGANPQLGDTLDFELPPSQIPHSELKGYEGNKGWFPNLEAFVSKSMQASSVDKHGLIQWYREMFPHHKPVNRMDIQETESWLHTHSMSICRRVQEYQNGLAMERAAAAKKLQQEGKGEVLPDPEPVAIKLCWSKILNSSSPLQNTVPDQELSVLLAVETVRLLSETYSMANRELVRQVACTSKERAELMERLWYNSQTIFKPVLEFAAGLTPNYLEALKEVATLKAKLRSTHEEHSLVRSLLKDTEARLILLAREKNLLKKDVLDKEGMVAQMSHGAVKTLEFDNIVTKYEQEHELRESLDFELGQKEDQLREMEERLEKALDENASLTEELKAAKDHLRIVTPRPEFNDRVVTDNLDDEEMATTASRVEAYELEIQRLRDQLAKSQAMLAKKEVEEKNSVRMEDVAQFLRGKRQSDARAQNSFSWAKLEAHLKEDENKGVPPRTHWFGLGDGKDFPAFLKASTSTKLKNRQMSKADTESLVKKVWLEKKTEDAKREEERKDKLDLPTYLGVFMKAEYGVDSMIPEMGYNFLAGLYKYQYDADCELFLKIVSGEVGEEVYWDQIKLLSDLQTLFVTLDEKANGGKTMGSIPLGAFKIGLREFFKSKSEDDFDVLIEALRIQCEKAHKHEWKMKQVVYTQLFEEDEKADQGPFAEAVRDQHLKLRVEYIEDLESMLTLVNGTNEKVDVKTAAKAIQGVDQGLSPQALNELVARGFCRDPSEILDAATDDAVDPIPVTDFLKNFKSGIISRVAKRANAKAVKDTAGRKGRRGSTRLTMVANAVGAAAKSKTTKL